MVDDNAKRPVSLIFETAIFSMEKPNIPILDNRGDCF
jgi:hypothetical protein